MASYPAAAKLFALGWFEVGDDFADLRPQRVDGSLGGRTRRGLHLGEGRFDRLEIGAVGRKVKQARAATSIASRTPAADL